MSPVFIYLTQLPSPAASVVQMYIAIKIMNLLRYLHIWPLSHSVITVIASQLSLSTPENIDNITQLTRDREGGGNVMCGIFCFILFSHYIYLNQRSTIKLATRVSSSTVSGVYCKNINVMYNNDTLIQVEVSRKPGHSPLCWQKQRYKVRESLHLPIVSLSRNVSGVAH